MFSISIDVYVNDICKIQIDCIIYVTCMYIYVHYVGVCVCVDAYA